VDPVSDSVPRRADKSIPALGILEGLSQSIIALLGRFSMAAVFWKSGQTKIEGLAIDIVEGTFELSWPRLSESAVLLFREEYQLPLLPAEFAAYLTASIEHVCPLLLIGLGTRFAALILLGMTIVIQVFVYPDAYPTHGTWATVLLYLIMAGPGHFSLDYGLKRGLRGKH
jgi:putative oxidoreductase